MNKIIRRQIFMGDSLSDRGTLNQEKLFNFVPMSLLAGLAGESPRGRFTNGFLWVDQLAAMGIDQLEILSWLRKKQEKETAANNADLADAYISGEHLRMLIQRAFTLDDDQNICFNGKPYIISRCIGGTTSYNWKNEFTFHAAQEGARLMVSNLDEIREQLLKDEEKYKVTQDEKDETLITEWTGANDLITVNTEPSIAAADAAVAARIANIEAMIQEGYKNFVLMNLPDLSLTPRFQNLNDENAEQQRQNAKEVSAYFNDKLQRKAIELQNKYHDQNIFLDVFDVSSLLTEVYNNPKKYEFDEDKLKVPYTDSDEFKENSKNLDDQSKMTSPAKGYMFWNDVHPSAQMHAWLPLKYKEKYNTIFDFKNPGSHHDELRVQQEHMEVKRELNALEGNLGLNSSQNINMGGLDDLRQAYFRRKAQKENDSSAADQKIEPELIDANQTHHSVQATHDYEKPNLEDIPNHQIEDSYVRLEDSVNENMSEDTPLLTKKSPKLFNWDDTELTNEISSILKTIQNHMIDLSRKSNKVAQTKWVKLEEILDNIYSNHELNNISEVVNAQKNNEAITTHQNPNLDRFFKKTTTKSYDLLTALVKAVDKELQYSKTANAFL